MPPNHFESEVESFLEGSHGDRTHIKRADHHTVTPLCGTLLNDRAAAVGGFALHEAFWRRVAGVSDPRVVQFPRLVAVGSRRGVSESRVSRNFARNSLDGVPSFEGRSLGLQRFLASLKNDRWKLRAKFVWRSVFVARVELSDGHSCKHPAAGKTKAPKRMRRGLAGGSDRRRSGDLSIFSRTLYQLSYRALGWNRPDHF